MERLLLGLPNIAIKNIQYLPHCILEVEKTVKESCPHCSGDILRTKDSFWRDIKSFRVASKPVTLRIRCHKFRCAQCGKYFHTRIPGIRLWSRSTELLKKNVFQDANRGISNKDIARLHGIAVSTVERFYHQVIQLENSRLNNRECPRFLGIDEHRFSRAKGFATTFCDLKKHRIFDVALGKSSAALHEFLCHLKGRERVRVVCIDMNSGYRSLVRQYFPHALIVSDRFHVIRLVHQHFAALCKALDEKTFSGKHYRLLRLMMLQRSQLTAEQQQRIQEYLSRNPALLAVYEFCHDMNDLLRHRQQNKQKCRTLSSQLLSCIEQLRQSPFPAMKSLGRTFDSWKEEIARMFRFSRNNGITEGFHRKMKLIQRRAYGFKNFENYRLRVRVLCG